MRKTTTLTKVMWVGVAVGFLGAGICFAASNIDGADKFAWSSLTGWLNFSPAHGGVTVVRDGANGYLKGYVWAENVGWIKLGAGDGNGPYANTSSSNWGVNMDAAGNLSGYGWSSHAGWINPNPTHGQVTIVPGTGSFDGFAWGENIGWIHFKNASPPQYSVQLILHTLTYHAGPGGTIDGATSLTQTVEQGGNSSTVSAVADSAYHFVAWSDGVLTATRTDTNVMEDITVTANFAISQYTLNYTAGPHGSITGTTPQTANHGGDGMEVTAVPAEGYRFVRWSDARTDNPRTDTDVTGDITVTAEFAPVEPARTRDWPTYR